MNKYNNRLMTILETSQNSYKPTNRPIPESMQKAETHTTRLKANDTEYIKAWNTNPLVQKIQDGLHTQATDETSGIADLATGIIEAGRPMTWGREIVKLKYTDKEKCKIILDDPGQATQVGSTDTYSLHSKASRHRFVEIDCKTVIDSTEQVDRQQLEDNDWDTLYEMQQSSIKNLNELETKIILSKFKELETNAGKAGKVVKGSGGNQIDDPTADLLIELKSMVAQKNHKPNVFVMGEATYHAMLKEEDFKSSDYFQGLINFENPSMSTFMFLGCKLCVSTLVPADTIYCFDSNAAVAMALRRDNLLMPFMDAQHDISGIKASSRFGVEIARPEAFSHWGVA